MTTSLSRRSLFVGAATVVVGGVAGFAVGRASGAADGNPGDVMTVRYGATQPRRTLLTSLSKLPRGGGVVIAARKVVVTRDSTGAVHGFSAVCTHQGCLVTQVNGGTIDCPCHGSRFNATTGVVVTGPATSPLPTVAVTVHAGNVYGT